MFTLLSLVELLVSTGILLSIMFQPIINIQRLVSRNNVIHPFALNIKTVVFFNICVIIVQAQIKFMQTSYTAIGRCKVKYFLRQLELAWEVCKLMGNRAFLLGHDYLLL